MGRRGTLALRDGGARTQGLPATEHLLHLLARGRPWVKILIAPPVNIRFNQTTKIGSKMRGEFAYPKMVPLALTHSHIAVRESKHVDPRQMADGMVPDGTR